MKSVFRKVETLINSISLQRFERHYSHKKGIVVGVYQGCSGEPRLTCAGSQLDKEVGGQLLQVLKRRNLLKSEVYVMTNVASCEYSAVALVGAGDENAGYNCFEYLDESRENTRIAAGLGTKALHELKMGEVVVDGLANHEAAAEGAWLSSYSYRAADDTHQPEPRISPHPYSNRSAWDKGAMKARAQNLARELEDAPPILINPETFSKKAVEVLCPYGIKVEVRDYDWLKRMKMNSFLAFGSSSCQSPKFLEITYCGATSEQKPILLVGKGVTFDSGGIGLRTCEELWDRKADMAGAAVVLGVFKAAADLGTPVNLIGLIPLCESMTSCSSVRPGDVLLSMNGKMVKVGDASKADRLLLADSLAYAASFRPSLVITVATLTAGVKAALGQVCSGLFTNSDAVWVEMCRAGAETGDRLWRMPLWEISKKTLKGSSSTGMIDIAKESSGDSCTAAAFLTGNSRIGVNSPRPDRQSEGRVSARCRVGRASTQP